MRMSKLKSDNEELKQYDNRLCLRIEGVPLVEKETSEDVIGKVKSITSESGCDIPDVIIDIAHCIGKDRYNTLVRAMWTVTQIDLVKTLLYSTFGYRTMLYRN